MTSFLYAMNIGTLATWLSVAGFGTVGIVVPVTVEILNQDDQSKDPYADLESIELTEDLNLGDTPPSQETDTGSTGEAEEIDVPFAEQETLPTPPEMPVVAEITPLPEIPDMPPPATKPAETAAPAPTQPRPVPRPNNKTPTRSNMATSATGGSPQGKAEAKGKVGDGGRNGGSGISDAQRLAGGRMPPPSYPSEARTKGQTGTVVVEFVVGENGSVVSAYAKNPSPWPILNERAISTVRRWKFRPGSVAKFTRPIVFKLN
ncbi:MAG: TonB family protein [Verrucomicrobiota bacterium]